MVFHILHGVIGNIANAEGRVLAADIGTNLDKAKGIETDDGFDDGEDGKGHPIEDGGRIFVKDREEQNEADVLIEGNKACDQSQGSHDHYRGEDKERTIGFLLLGVIEALA